MGWCSEDPRHEGYVIGMVPRDFPLERAGACSVLSSTGSRFQHTDEWPLRELGATGVVDAQRAHPLPGNDGTESRGAVDNIELVHVTCTCGWRSPLQRVRGAEWWPNITAMAPELEDAAHELWKEHIDGQAIDGVQVLARAGKYRLERAARANVHEIARAREVRALRGTT